MDLARENDVLFFPTPHGVSARESPAVLDAAPDVRVVDLSGDLGLRDAAQYEQHFDMQSEERNCRSTRAVSAPSR